MSTEQWDTDRRVIKAMKKYGGSFVHALAVAALVADDDNRRRIRETWPEYWAKYAQMAEQLDNKEESYGTRES